MPFSLFSVSQLEVNAHSTHFPHYNKPFPEEITGTSCLQASSVTMTAAVGSTLQKGEELGFFTCGGSDVILLLQATAKPVQKHHGHGKSLLYGIQIAKCSTKEQK